MPDVTAPRSKKSNNRTDISEGGSYDKAEGNVMQLN
jgi:hypothetical protein